MLSLRSFPLISAVTESKIVPGATGKRAGPSASSLLPITGTPPVATQ